MFARSRTVFIDGEEYTDTRDFSASRKASKPYCLLESENTENHVVRVDVSDTMALKKMPEGSVVVIPISGVITREDGWSHYGTDTQSKFLKAAYQAENIKGIVLDINSGGGEVDGTMSFSNLIKKRTKPVVALVNSMAASAAYWIAENADVILMGDHTARVGSIGVMMTVYDDKEYLENIGIKVHEILADGSEDKNKGYYDALKSKYTTIKKESLNPLREMFAQSVIDARGGKIDLEKENVLSGKMYFATSTDAGNKSAIEVGLADGIGDMDKAVSEVLRLADMAKYSQNKSKSNF